MNLKQRWAVFIVLVLVFGIIEWDAYQQRADRAADQAAINHILSSEKLWRMVNSRGGVIIWNPDDPLWHGKVPYVEKRLHELIAILESPDAPIEAAQHFGITNKEYVVHMDLPLIAAVANLKTLWGQDDGPIEIYASNLFLLRNSCIDKVLAHEMAHQFTPRHGHDRVWRKLFDYLRFHLSNYNELSTRACF